MIWLICLMINRIYSNLAAWPIRAHVVYLLQCVERKELIHTTQALDLKIYMTFF